LDTILEHGRPMAQRFGTVQRAYVYRRYKPQKDSNSFAVIYNEFMLIQLSSQCGVENWIRLPAQSDPKITGSWVNSFFYNRSILNFRGLISTERWQVSFATTENALTGEKATIRQRLFMDDTFTVTDLAREIKTMFDERGTRVCPSN
jgi:hypothetical protein